MSDKLKNIVQRKEELIKRISDIKEEIDRVIAITINTDEYEVGQYLTIDYLNRTKKALERKLDKLTDEEVLVTLNEI